MFLMTYDKFSFCFLLPLDLNYKALEIRFQPNNNVNILCGHFKMKLFITSVYIKKNMRNSYNVNK